MGLPSLVQIKLMPLLSSLAITDFKLTSLGRDVLAALLKRPVDEQDG